MSNHLQLRDRISDDPALKESITSQLFGEIIGFMKTTGLTKGKEYETDIKQIFQCSRKILWIDRYHPIYNMTLVLNSVQMSAEFGVVIKETKEVIYRNKLENLRYKLSDGEPLTLIDSHQVKFDAFLQNFKNEFNKLKNDKEI